MSNIFEKRMKLFDGTNKSPQQVAVLHLVGCDYLKFYFLHALVPYILKYMAVDYLRF